MKFVFLLSCAFLFFLDIVKAQGAAVKIRVAADCAEPYDPKNYSENRNCVRKAIIKTARVACANHKQGYTKKPAISLSCAQQGELYICKGEAMISCDGRSTDIATQMEDWLSSQ